MLSKLKGLFSKNNRAKKKESVPARTTGTTTSRDLHSTQAENQRQVDRQAAILLMMDIDIESSQRMGAQIKHQEAIIPRSFVEDEPKSSNSISDSDNSRSSSSYDSGSSYSSGSSYDSDSSSSSSYD